MKVKEAEKMQTDFEGNKKLFYKWIRKARQGGSKGISGVKGSNGEMIWEEESVREGWKEYFEELYGGGGASWVNERESNELNGRNEVANVKISLWEALIAIGKLKNGKSAEKLELVGKRKMLGGMTLLNKLSRRKRMRI